MRWNFVRRTWVKTSPELSDSNRKKTKPKRTRLWTFLCSQRKPTSLQSSKEEVSTSYRRSRTSQKFGAKHAASIESISDLMINFPRKSGVYNPPFLPSTIVTSSSNQRKSAFGFCPNCHNIVLPVLEQLSRNQILAENGLKDVGEVEQNTRSLDEVQYWPYDADASCNTIYESVYEGMSSSFAQMDDWDWSPDLNTLVGRTDAGCIQSNLDSSLIYDTCNYQVSDRQFPSIPWASSTLKRGKRTLTDCETIYDEVASDIEDPESYRLDFLPSGMEKDVRPYRKRCAPQFDDGCNQMKRIRREFFVYEE